MRCDECLLERQDSGGLPLDTFLERLTACDGCPLIEGPGASPVVRLLVAKHREAARSLRKLGTKARKLEGELHELSAETDRYEGRIAKLESLHKASTQELEAQVELARRQEEALLSMSAPIIRVWKGVLALPIIGKVDNERAQVMTTTLLESIRDTGSRYAILDLTGVEEVDAATADHLLKVFGAVRLLGARVILTGMQARVAQAIVALDVDLSAMTTVRNVEEALRICMREDAQRARDYSQ